MKESDSSPGGSAESDRSGSAPGIPLLRQRVHRFRMDILIAIALAALAAVASHESQRLVGPFIALGPRSNNVWFEADSPRVFTNMVARTSDHTRTEVHPLFSLAAYPPVYFLRKALRIDPIEAVRIEIAAVAALWLSALFILLRLIGCQKFDAVLFSVLGATSATAMFWFAVPETYSFGSLSILLALLTMALMEHHNLSWWWVVASSAFTLSMTKTNWMAGIFGTFTSYPWKRALRITVLALGVVSLLWCFEKALFPSARFFVGGERAETRYLLLPRSGGPLKVLSSFVFHSMIMPSIAVVEKLDKQPWATMSTQASLPGSGSRWGVVGVGIWAVLLGLGITALFRMNRLPRFRMALALTILGQLGLHILYGDETFLYALHFGPLLIVLAALGLLTRARFLALGLAGALAVAAVANNGPRFREALAFVASHDPARHQVQSQMKLHPVAPENLAGRPSSAQ